MNFFTDTFRKWLGMLTNPGKTAKKESKKRNILESLAQVAFAGVLAAIISVLVPTQGMLELKALTGAASFYMISLAMIPAVFVLFWAISASVLYVFAHFLEGKGNLLQHAHIIALVNAPFGVLGVLLGPIPAVGGILSAAANLYSLYVLTIGLREVHKYSTGRAALTWLLPVLLLALIIVALVFTGFVSGLA
ncbi:MAG: YIP1 family protein [Candidatus Aenigmarchaeota archaeon]|nr:YIP1 family protein [Candidatus Aenigmarchaeota archaeon]